MLNIIVAYSTNNVIGNKNDLPWYLPADLKRFKQLTTGHSVIMGRKTFESIIARLKKPLPDRLNIVITSKPDPQYSEVKFVSSFEEALEQADKTDEVFAIGGARVFAAALPLADRIYATEIQQLVDGDVTFPEFDKNQWQINERLSFKADEKNSMDYDYVTYERKVHG